LTGKSEKIQALSPDLPGESRRTQLFAYSKSLDHHAISIDVFSFEIIEKAPALAHHPQQTTTGVVVLGVDFEVASQVGDLFAQNGNLNLRRTRIGVVSPIVVDDLRLPLSRE
jgi:hypothetical protein